MPDDVLLNTREVSAWDGFAVVTHEKWRAAGRGPKFIVVEGAIRYRVGDVKTWLGERIARSAR